MTERPFERPVIAITGSAGKSTTKEMIASILRRKWKILKTLHNYNGPIYTPRHRRTFQDESYQAAVLEYGLIDEARDVADHTAAFPPDIAVITHVGSAHIGVLGGDIKQVAAAKAGIFKGMNPQGLLVLNADDAGSKLLDTTGFTGKIITVGVEQPADYRGYDVQYVSDGMLFRVMIGGRSERFFIPIFGRHQVCNALLALAVADQLGFTYKDTRPGLRNYTRMTSRLSVIPLRDEMTLLDDSYSSNPHAARAAIDVLHEVSKGRKIAVLGDMLMLGAYTFQGHNEVGEYLASHPVDCLLTFGDHAQQIGTAAIGKGFPADRVFHVATDEIDKLHQSIDSLLIPGTTILLKASNGLKLWRTNQYITEHYSGGKQHE